MTYNDVTSFPEIVFKSKRPSKVAEVPKCYVIFRLPLNKYPTILPASMSHTERKKEREA